MAGEAAGTETVGLCKSSISILAFAVVFPTLAIRILIGETPKYKSNDKSLIAVADIMFYFGISVAFIGVIAAFWYIAWIVGVVFLVTTIVGTVLYFRMVRSTK